jgi:hypothetical protein
MSQPTQLSLCEYGRASRLRNLCVAGEQLSVRELLIIILAGAAAAVAVAFLPLQIRIPGHAVLKATLPIVCGIALVPRPWVGTMSGLAAMMTAAIFFLLGIGNLQAAAVTSLLVIGPAIDLALRGAKVGSAQLYLRFAFAGLLANLCAFGVRWGIALLQTGSLHPLHMKQMALWALESFSLCGLAAGVISGVLCFRNLARTENPQ